MSRDASIPPAYFDQIYAADSDPWHFETSAYEREKYATTLAALPRARYRRGFEVGCSIGVLTGLLAQRCGELLAVDVSEQALARARERCAGLSHVSFARMELPAEMPDGLFDLVLLSEVGYYWGLSALARAAEGLIERLERGGSLLLVHFTPPVPDYPLTGDAVHEHFLALAASGRLRHLGGERYARYRVDAFVAS